MAQRYTVGINAGSRPTHVEVEAEDALDAALKVKRDHPGATITYARRANERGDRRHPAPEATATGRSDA